MVRIARRDTYGLEDIGGVRVRRRIFTGQRIPDQYDVESDAFEEQGAPLEDVRSTTTVPDDELAGEEKVTPKPAARRRKPR